MVLSVLGLLLVAIVIVLLLDGWRAFGHKASGPARQPIEASMNWFDGKFRNDLPLRNNLFGSISDGLRSGNLKEPKESVSYYANDGSEYAKAAESGLRITWLGHSTLILELDATTLLIDPIWSERVSPSSWLGPKRYFQLPLSLDDLPAIDAVVISHDHYEHLDEQTITLLRDRVTKFIIPLGVDAHLRYWDIPEEKIETLDWWQTTTVNDIEIVATPARHASGRHLLDLDATLWSGYAFMGSQKVYYSGDTGLFPGFKEIGERLGPFDVTMIEVGAYSRNWPDWHLGPEQAVIANQWVRGKRLLPLHWGLFNLALHNWTEPMERVQQASSRVNLSVLTPQPGKPFEPGLAEYQQWWPDIPWQSADQHAVMSSQLESLTAEELSIIQGD